MSAYNNHINKNKQQSNLNNQINHNNNNDSTLHHNTLKSNQYTQNHTQPSSHSNYNYHYNQNQKTTYDYSAYTTPSFHSTTSTYVPPHLRSTTTTKLARYGTGEPPWSHSQSGVDNSYSYSDGGDTGGGKGDYGSGGRGEGSERDCNSGGIRAGGNSNTSRFNPNSAPFYHQNSQASTSQYPYQSDSNSRSYSTTSNSQAPYRSRSPPRSEYNYNNDTTTDYSYSDRSNNYPNTRSQNSTSSSNYRNNDYNNDYRSNRNEPRSRSPQSFISPNKWIPNTNTGPRKKMNRNVPTPLPSQSYLDITLLPSTTISPQASKDKKVLQKEIVPPLLILDLNNTLLCRASRTSHGSRNATLRPYLSTFLSYICGSTSSSSNPRQPTYQPIIYSSARNANVLQMLLSMSLISSKRVHSHPIGTAWISEENEPLKLVWSRENMGLSTEEFNEDVKTVKDLEGVWKILGMGKGEEELEEGGGVRRTVLLDDEAQKAAMQPYNHLPISPFSPLNHLQSAASPSNTSYRRTRERSPSPYSSSIPPSSTLTPSNLSTVPSDTSIDQTTTPKVDASLLSTIYLLEILRFQSNIPNFIRNDGLKVYYEMGEEELIERGKKICEGMGIKVHEKGEWDDSWRKW